MAIANRLPQFTITAAYGGAASQIARVEAQTNRYGDAAALFQALGGGWWNRPTSTQG